MAGTTQPYLVIGLPLGDTAARVVLPEDIRRMIWNAGVGSTVTLRLTAQVEAELFSRQSLRNP
jgi:hypothetical protein